MKTTKEQREIWRKSGSTDMQNLVDDIDGAFERAALACDDLSTVTTLLDGERAILGIAAHRIRSLK